MRSKNTPAATPAELEHLGRVKRMRCVCCDLMGRDQCSPTDVHHIRCNGQPRSHWLVLPLCHDDCHQGANGVEFTRTYLRILKMSEWDLLAVVIQWLMTEREGQTA